VQVLNSGVKTVIKRQTPYLVGGTISGAIMAYFIGFLPTLIINSAMWYIISLATYKLIWNVSGKADQRYLMAYILVRMHFKKQMTI
jgi:hypothetical protein